MFLEGIFFYRRQVESLDMFPDPHYLTLSIQTAKHIQYIYSHTITAYPYFESVGSVWVMQNCWATRKGFSSLDNVSTTRRGARWPHLCI